MCWLPRTIFAIQYLGLEVHSDFAVWHTVARYRGCESFCLYQGLSITFYDWGLLCPCTIKGFGTIGRNKGKICVSLVQFEITVFIYIIVKTFKIYLFAAHGFVKSSALFSPSPPVSLSLLTNFIFIIFSGVPNPSR